MKVSIRNEKGSALVTTLFFLLGLAVTGAIIVGIASSEKHVAFNEYTHVRAVNASDAGSEEAINWIRNRNKFDLAGMIPNTPALTQSTFSDLAELHVTGEDNRYMYDVTFMGPVRAFGDEGVTEFQFRVNATGASSQESEAAIEVRADRRLRVNRTYN